MSTIVQATQDQTIEMVSPVASPATGLGANELLVNFNLVIREALVKVEGNEDKGKAIIRCDNLPFVMGEERELRYLSNLLIDFILQHPPQRSKLFIYIKCILAESNEVQPRIPYGLKNYEICFHTNSCNESVWQLSSQERIAECKAICKKYEGSFTSAFGNADCLFKLTLPGKLY